MGITDVTMRHVTYTCTRCGREEKRSGRVEDAADWVRYPDGWVRVKLIDSDAMAGGEADLCVDCTEALSAFIQGALVDMEPA